MVTSREPVEVSLCDDDPLAEWQAIVIWPSGDNFGAAGDTYRVFSIHNAQMVHLALAENLTPQCAVLILVTYASMHALPGLVMDQAENLV